MNIKTYLALDLEMYWDEHLFEAHRAIDPKSSRHATATKRIMAASVFQFAVDCEGRVSVLDLRSWTELDWGDEEALLNQLFDYLRARSDIPVLTFGGLATDVPVLVLAAMEHGVRLPPQLIDQPGRKGPRPHLDLGLMLKAGGRTWSHLSQVLLRMNMPDELVAAKPSVSRPSEDAEWLALRDHVELDCLLLAIAKLGWLVAQGTDALRLGPATIALIASFLRLRTHHAMAPLLIDYVADLEGELALSAVCD